MRITEKYYQDLLRWKRLLWQKNTDVQKFKVPEEDLDQIIIQKEKLTANTRKWKKI